MKGFKNLSLTSLCPRCIRKLETRKSSAEMRAFMKDKVILAYSGGLDTTAIIPWLKENYDYEVVCCCIDVGQGNELDGLEERAKLSGAAKLYIDTLKYT